MSKRRLLLSGLLAALVVAGVFLGYRYHQSRQPRGSIERLVAACQARDLEGFRRYVDEDALVTSAVDEVLAKVLPAGKPDGGHPVDQLLSGLGAGLSQAIKPELAHKARGMIETALLSGDLAHLRVGEAPPVGQAAPDGANVFVGAVRLEGDVAHVAVTYLPPGSKTPFAPDVVMRWRDDHWQVKAVGNLLEQLGLLRLLLGPSFPGASM